MANGKSGKSGKGKGKEKPLDLTNNESFNAILWGVLIASTGFCIQMVLDRWISRDMVDRLLSSEGALHIWGVFSVCIACTFTILRYIRFNKASLIEFVAHWSGAMLLPFLLSTVMFELQGLGYLNKGWVHNGAVSVVIVTYVAAILIFAVPRWRKAFVPMGLNEILSTMGIGFSVIILGGMVMLMNVVS